MKKILFVANVDKEHILKFHLPMIKKFVDKGWRVDVACAGEETIPFITKRFRMKWKRSPFTLNIFFEIRKLKHIIASNQYDIVYCHTPVGGLASRIAAKGARKRGTKVIYFAHGFHFYKGAPLLNWCLYYPIEKLLSKYTDLLITINDEDYALAKKKFCKGLNVFLSKGVGVDLNKFSNVNFSQERERYRKELRIRNDEVVLGYVAEINKNKNQTMLLDCLKELKKMNIEAKLVLIGPDHTNGRFLKSICKKKLGDDVVLTGWRNDANHIISVFDFCVPSSIREGLGLNIIEAMNKGIPVIANDNRGHRTIIKNYTNGVLVPLNNYKEMAARIGFLIKNEADRNNLVKNAHSTVGEYNIDLVVESLYSLIKSLIE